MQNNVLYQFHVKTTVDNITEGMKKKLEADRRLAHEEEKIVEKEAALTSMETTYVATKAEYDKIHEEVERTTQVSETSPYSPKNTWKKNCKKKNTCRSSRHTNVAMSRCMKI